MSDNFTRVTSGLATAQTAADYNQAKRIAARLPDSEQFRSIDHFIACRRRLEAQGVL